MRRYWIYKDKYKNLSVRLWAYSDWIDIWNLNAVLGIQIQALDEPVCLIPKMANIEKYVILS